MKAQETPGNTMGPGPFLIRMFWLHRSSVENESSKGACHDPSRTNGGDAPTAPGAVIRSTEAAIKAPSTNPVMVNLGPVLGLLLMLRNRHPRRHRPRLHELHLPPGCVLAVRYASR